MSFARPVIAAVVVMAALAALPQSSASQTSDLQASVDEFYPVDRLKPLTAAERQSCFAQLDASGGGPPLLLAGYTNRSAGALRLLRRAEGGQYRVAFDSPDSWVLPGARCAIRLRDVDFDGQPEVFVYFQGVRASSGWIFKWDGAALRNLTPTETIEGRVSSLLLDPQLYDLDHQGALEVIAARIVERPAAGVRSKNPGFVYGLTESGYVVQSSLLAVAAYRADVDPRSNLRAFRLLEDSTGPYRLRVVNGDRFGKHRVSGATIQVNELPVLEPRDLTGDMAFASVTVPPLSVQNHITATLSGPADGTLL